MVSPQPEFQLLPSGFRVKVFSKAYMDYDHKLGNKLGNNKQMIFGCLKKNAGISLSQFSKIVGISQTAIENNIAKLKKQGQEEGKICFDELNINFDKAIRILYFQ